MSLLDLQTPANVPEHVVTAVQTQLEFLAPKCGLAVTAAVGREASLQIATVEAGAHYEGDAERSWFRVGDPMRRCAAMVMDPAAVARLAELFMGGDGRGEDRSPGPLEWSIVVRRLGSLLTGLDEMLRTFGVEESDVAVVESVSDLNLEPHQVRATIEVRIGDVGIPITLVLPASHHAVRAVVPVETSAALAEALSDVPVSVAIRFESVMLSVEELDDLALGDVIRLDQPETAALVGLIDGRRMFTGHMGRHGRRMALKINGVSQ